MTFLLDTCVLSDLERGRRHPHLQVWRAATHVDAIAVPVIALAEVRLGANKLRAQGADSDADRIELWLRGVSLAFRIVPFDSRAALLWSDIACSVRHDGSRSFERDLMIAATAMAGGFTLATRNVRHFLPMASRFPELVIFDPYRASEMRQAEVFSAA